MEIRPIESDDWPMVKKILRSCFSTKKQANGEFKRLRKLNKSKSITISINSVDFNIIGFSVKQNGIIKAYLEELCWELEIPKN